MNWLNGRFQSKVSESCDSDKCILHFAKYIVYIEQMGKDSFAIFEKIFPGDRSKYVRKDNDPNILGVISEFMRAHTTYRYNVVERKSAGLQRVRERNSRCTTQRSSGPGACVCAAGG